MKAVSTGICKISGGLFSTALSTETRLQLFSASDLKMLALCPILARHIFAELEENPGVESPSLDVCLVCGLMVDKRGREKEQKAEEELAGVCC